MSCSLCKSTATHQCTKEPRSYCTPHAGVGRCCVTFAEFAELRERERQRLGRCATPACSAVIPAQLDELGPRGWHELVIELRPLGSGFTVGQGTPAPINVRLCPACSADRLLLASVAVDGLLR